MQTVQKATDDQITESYAKTNSVWKTAQELGMCGQSVHERLVKLGKSNPKALTPQPHLELIKETYQKGFSRGDGSIKSLVLATGLNRQQISRYAKKAGLSNATRPMAKTLKESISALRVGMWSTNQHPRGMLGKSHTQTTKDEMSIARTGHVMNPESVMQAQKTRVERYGSGYHRRICVTWKQGWREIGGQKIYARSRWEANYARYLQFLLEHKEIKAWRHEPTTFWFEGIKRGVRSYLPDFEVTTNDGQIEFHEVKGWMDDRSKTKLKRMKKYHPNVKVKVYDTKWFKANGRKLAGIISGWESSRA